VGLQLALVLSSAATVWAVSLALGTGLARWPVGLRRTHGWLVVPFGLLPVGLVIAVGWAPPVPSLLTTTLGLALALLWRRAVTWLRRTDLLARLLAVLCAVLLPALPLYVALVELTDIARHRLLEDRYAVQTIEHPEDLRRRLRLAQDQIDAIPDLRSLTGAPAGAEGGSLDTDRAFSIWRRTALAASRLTSAVELYGRDRSLSSRFALNIPEYGVTSPRWTGTGCDWEVFGEGAPLGSRERRMLHAERGLCEPGPDGTPVLAGAVVVHAAQVDYESLSFISPQSPYVELFQEAGRETRPDPRGHEIELVIYGWGLQPTFVSSRTAWAIDDALFQRIYASRDAFWTRLGKDDAVYDVLISNDRAGVYALGFPVHSALDHLLHLSEIAILVLAAFVLALVAIFVAGLILAGGRGGLPFREVRARFALKLQLWFVGVATVPVVVVAVLIQGYFAEQLRADVEAGAARTAAVARSVIEESVVLQPVDGQLITPFTDDVLVWISQIIGQDVHIFDGSQLVATSERDLYASGLLPTRTPDTVYRAIALERLPSFVGEDAIGALTYQLAAAPVRAGGRDAILTVPLASRQREIESEIDELNRRVWAFALFFAAIVGLIGWVIARSIAQPVKRLTRATSLPCADIGEPCRRPTGAGGGALGGRAGGPRIGLQQDGGGARRPAPPARAHPPARSLERNGATGGARDQEPADTGPAERGASQAGARRPRRTPVAGTRGVRGVHPEAGTDSPSDRVGVLELRVVAGRRPCADGGRRAHSGHYRTVSSRALWPDRRAGGPSRRPPGAPSGPSADAAGAHQHRRECAPRDARQRDPPARCHGSS